MTYRLCSEALAAPVLGGAGLRWFLVIAVLAGVAVAVAAVRNARRRSPGQAPPMIRPRLLPHDDEDRPA